MNVSLTPTDLKKFVIHSDIASSLLKIDSDNLLNIMFYGPINAGKKTLMRAYLNYITGADVQAASSLNNCELKIGNNKVNIDYISSPYHLEINLYEYGLYDKHILGKFIKAQIEYTSIHKPVCKFIVINHFDYISKESQVYLKLLLDKAIDNVRFILIVESISNIESSVTSRLLNIRVPKPPEDILARYISYCSDNGYKLSKVNQKKILNYSKLDLFSINNAIHCMTHNKKLEYSQINTIDKYITDIMDLISKKDIMSILGIRQVCYNLLLINVTMKHVLKEVYRRYMATNSISDKIKMSITEIACRIQEKMCFVEHDLICLEFFSLKVKKLLIHN